MSLYESPIMLNIGNLNIGALYGSGTSAKNCNGNGAGTGGAPCSGHGLTTSGGNCNGSGKTT